MAVVILIQMINAYSICTRYVLNVVCHWITDAISMDAQS